MAMAMAILDVLGLVLVLGATVGFSLGALALARSNDMEAVFFLVAGFTSLRAGRQLARQGSRA